MHFDVIGALAALAILYEYGLRRLAPLYAPRGEIAVTKKQRWLFYSGILSLYLVSSWPLHDIGENSLFLFHMGEHLVFGLVAPPLLHLGDPVVADPPRSEADACPCSASSPSRSWRWRYSTACSG